MQAGRGARDQSAQLTTGIVELQRIIDEDEGRTAIGDRREDRLRVDGLDATPAAELVTNDDRCVARRPRQSDEGSRAAGPGRTEDQGVLSRVKVKYGRREVAVGDGDAQLGPARRDVDCGLGVGPGDLGSQLADLMGWRRQR